MANEEVTGLAVGAATGAAKGAAIGAIAGPGGAVFGAGVGAVIGGIGGLLGGGSRGRANRARREARAAARRRAASLTALSGVAADRARRAIIKEATIKRAETVATTEATGVKGSGREGAVGTIFSQLAGELQFEKTSQQLSRKAGREAQEVSRLESKANVFASQASTIDAFTGTVFEVGAAYAGSIKKPPTGAVTSKPSVFNQ